jgi:signal transduction histidine kinase
MFELQILYIISFFANFFIGLFILLINSKKLINKIYSLFAFFVGLWSLGLFVENTSLSYFGSLSGSALAITSANFISPLLLVFFLIFSKNKLIFKHKIIIYLIFLPALIFTCLNLTTNLISRGLHEVPWGYDAIEGVLYYPMTYIIFLFSFIGVLIGIVFYRKTKNISEKIQTRNILIAITIPLVGGFISEIVLPLNKIQIIPLTTIFSTISAIIIGFTIVKHRLMTPYIFSIKTKITSSFLIIIILFGVVGFISVYQSKEVMTNIIAENAEISVAESMDKIEITTYNRIEDWKYFINEKYFEDQIIISNNNFTEIGNYKETINYIQIIDNGWINNSQYHNSKFFLELINNNISKKLSNRVDFYNSNNNYSLFGEAFLTNKYGAIVGLTNKTTDYYQADEQWWQEAKTKGFYINNVSYDESANIYSLDIVVRVDDDFGEFLGILKVVWNIREIDQIVHESIYKNKFSQEDLVYTLLDGQGRIVYSTYNFNFFEKKEELFSNIKSNSVIDKNYFILNEKNHSRTLISFAYSDGYKTINGLNLILVYSYNENKIFSPYYDFKNYIYLTTVVIAIVALLIALIISHYFSKPILKLKSLTDSISKGNFNIDISKKDSKDEISALTQSFKDMADKIKKYDENQKFLIKQKDEFINQLGHDLKNPLNPLINLLPLITKGEKDKKKVEMLDLINRNVGYMKDLVIKTIELARLNSPNTQFNIEDINLSDETNKVIDTNKLIFDQKNIKVVNKISNNLWVSADKLRFDEILNNLLDNSIKYAYNSGKIILDAEEDKNFVKISIKDTGIGMNQKQLTQIFNEFYKADPSRHDFDSSGLGLPICKRIVERHSGSIWAESEGIGKGSTFYFTLPIKDKNVKRSDEKENIKDKDYQYISRDIDRILDDYFDK